MPLLRSPKRRAAVEAANTRALVASAVLVKQSALREIPEQRDWQDRAWEFWDRCGELRFAGLWMSNALSRCRLYVGVPDPAAGGEPAPVNDPDTDGDPRAADPLEELFGGPTGHGDALSRLAIHLTLPGESYIVGLDDPDNGERRWLVASGDEFTKTSREVKVRLPESNRQIVVNLSSSTVIRLWRQHARRAWEADSPVRALLPTLKELLDATAHITATLESRLAGAGIIWMPEGTILPTTPAQPGQQPLHADPGMATLIDTMITPIGNRDSASAVVPILARVPSTPKDMQQIKPEHMTFSTPLDEKVLALRDSAIRRLAIGLDMPPEVLLGLGESNHWNAWQISESALTMHVEPLLALICNALTEKYLRPALEAQGVADAARYVIWFDASELIQRPNRSPEAQTLHDKLLVKAAVARREAGFGEDDAPDDDEFRRMLLVQLTLKGVDPALVAPYLRELGIDLQLPAAAAPVPEPRGGGETGQPAPTGQPGGAPPNPVPTARPEIPSTPGNPANPNPPKPSARPAPAPAAAAAAAGVVPLFTLTGVHPLAAVEMAVLRALEMVGKRLLNWGGRAWRNKIDCAPWEIHTRIPASDYDPEKLLQDVYLSMEHVFAGRPDVQAVVDTYVRTLIASQRRHTLDGLATALAQARCFAATGTDHAA